VRVETLPGVRQVENDRGELRPTSCGRPSKFPGARSSNYAAE
jgi:hypothetical protein